MSTENLLFYRFDWSSAKSNQESRLKDEIENYNGNKLLNTSVDDLAQYFAEKYSFEVPSLIKENIVASQREAKIDMSHNPSYGFSFDGGPNLVDGSTIELTIPFRGEADGFQMKPSTFDFSPPRAKARNGNIILEFTGVNQETNKLKRQIDDAIDKIEKYLEYLTSDVSKYNSALLSKAKIQIESRRKKLLNNQNLVASLGFELKENKEGARTYSAPSVRRKIIPNPPSSKSTPFHPEPTLQASDYEHILSILENMTHVMERSPASFTSMDEEALRTHFLVQLNGHFEGNATGETFNYQGKTDILIRENGKNIFIAECKFWGGAKVLTNTIDQLLGYSSWRDTKVAVILFNRNKDFGNVLKSVKETVPTHKNFKRELEARSESAYRYCFSHRDDPNREMTLTVMNFDIPKNG